MEEVNLLTVPAHAHSFRTPAEEEPSTAIVTAPPAEEDEVESTPTIVTLSPLKVVVRESTMGRLVLSLLLHQPCASCRLASRNAPPSRAHRVFSPRQRACVQFWSFLTLWRELTVVRVLTRVLWLTARWPQNRGQC